MTEEYEGIGLHVPACIVITRGSDVMRYTLARLFKQFGKRDILLPR